MLSFLLVHTRDVDKTIANILEGRVRYDTGPSSSDVSDCYRLSVITCCVCRHQQPLLLVGVT